MRTRSVLVYLCTVLACVFIAACSSTPPSPPEERAPEGPPWFEDITEEAGIRFTHDAGPVGTYFLPQQVGSGAAMFDANGDGKLDILEVLRSGKDSARVHGGSESPGRCLRLENDEVTETRST